MKAGMAQLAGVSFLTVLKLKNEAFFIK